MKTEILGFKHSQGDVDGNKYDFITVYCIARLPTKENQKGRAGIEMRADLSLKQRFEAIDYKTNPIAELEIEKVAIGKGMTTDLVVEFKILPPVKII